MEPGREPQVAALVLPLVRSLPHWIPDSVTVSLAEATLAEQVLRLPPPVLELAAAAGAAAASGAGAAAGAVPSVGTGASDERPQPNWTKLMTAVATIATNHSAVFLLIAAPPFAGSGP